MTAILIALEGIDGSGKSTQGKRLAKYLESLEMANVFTSEPTRGVFGMRIRNASARLELEEERELFLNDRKEHVETVIMPSLGRGHSVICDRYYYSSVAYQGARAPKEQRLDYMRRIARENEVFAPFAKILVYFDIRPDHAIERIKRSRASLDVFETLENQKRVYEAFDVIVAAHSCVIRCDANRGEDEVFSQIREGLHRKFEDKDFLNRSASALRF